MRYWDDMQTKFGFSDGDAVPPDAEARRAVYVQAINALATRLGSAYRVAAWDRGGMHNSCLIITEPGDGDEMDDAMRRAIDIAMEMDLDQYVEIQVEISINEDELDEVLTHLELNEETA